MITYKWLDKGGIAVYIEGRRTGTINVVKGGFAYFPKYITGNKLQGEVFSTIADVKLSLK